MRNTRTISLLELLTTSELTSLGKYLKSPFFTNKKHLYTLLSELRRLGRNAADKREACFERVFPGEPFNGHKWNKALSDLNDCIEDFLAVQHLKRDKALYQKALVDACYDRLYEPVMQRATYRVLNQFPGKDTPEQLDGWQLRFWGKKRALTHPLKNRIKLSQANLDELESDLDAFYLISKTQLACNRVSGSYLFNWTDEMQQCLQWFYTLQKAGGMQKSRLLKIYTSLLGLLLEVYDFSPFFSALKHNSEGVHPNELRDVVRLAFNYCIRQDRMGHSKALEWYYSLYNWSSEQSLWSAPKAEELFLNLGVLISKVQKINAFQDLLDTNRYALPEKRQEQAEFLLWACWHFYAEDFAAAQLNLARVSTRHPRYALLRHSINVRNAFMLWKQGQMDYETLEGQLNSFNNFLEYKNNPFAESLAQPYRTLVSAIRRLTAMSTYQGESVERLRKEVLFKKSACVDWLEKVINSWQSTM